MVISWWFESLILHLAPGHLTSSKVSMLKSGYMEKVLNPTQPNIIEAANINQDSRIQCYRAEKRPMFDSSAVFLCGFLLITMQPQRLHLSPWAPISSHDEVCNKDRFWADLKNCSVGIEESAELAESLLKSTSIQSVIPIDHARANMINTWYLMASSMPYVKMFFVLLFRCAWGPLVGVFFAKDRQAPSFTSP